MDLYGPWLAVGGGVPPTWVEQVISKGLGGWPKCWGCRVACTSGGIVSIPRGS